MHFAYTTLPFVRTNSLSLLSSSEGCDFFLLRPYFLIRRYSLTFVILTLSEAMRKDLCILLSLRRCSPTRTPSRWHPERSASMMFFSRMPSARSEEPVLSEAEGTYAFCLHYVAVRQYQ